MNAKAISWSLIIVVASLMLSSCSQQKGLSKVQKTREKSESLAAAKKLENEANNAFTMISRQLTIAKNKIKYGDSTCAAIYRPIFETLSDSLEICRLKLADARIEFAKINGQKIKTKKIKAGRVGFNSFASNNSSYIPVRMKSGPKCTNCSGSWSPRR